MVSSFVVPCSCRVAGTGRQQDVAGRKGAQDSLCAVPARARPCALVLHVPGTGGWTRPRSDKFRPENLTTVLPALCAPAGSPGPLQCYSVGPLGILNCSWEPLGDLETPPVLYHQSQK